MVPEENPYALLGLLPGSPASEVKRRYRQLAKKYHPDANHDVSAEETLRALNAAYALLSDPARKAAYDTAFAARVAVFNPARVPSSSAPRMYRRRGPSARAAFGATLLFLLSAGAGFLFSVENAGPALSGLYLQLSGRAARPDRPPLPYTFVPSHGAFDNTSDGGVSSPGADASAPAVPNQAGLP